MNKLQDIMPAFWWVNPWNTARCLRKACDALSRAWTEEIERNTLLEKKVDELYKEIDDGHLESAEKCRSLAVAYGEIAELKKTERARPKRSTRTYESPVADKIRAASKEGLTLEQACKKYGFNKGTARVLASKHKISFAWSGKGRRPKFNA